MSKIYSYVRVSTKSQSIARQIKAIKESYPAAEIVAEKYTGTKEDGREVWKMLKAKVSKGDTIVFDSVSRMSRNADDGIKDYMELFDKGVELVFLNEPLINTEVYRESLVDKIELIGTDEDELFKGINNYLRKLATKQIKLAFAQSEKEVKDIKKRCEGGRKAKENKAKPSRKGKTLNVYKEKYIKAWIKEYSKDFEGKQDDTRVRMSVLNEIALHNEKVQRLWNTGNANENEDKMINQTLSRNTYYKYKKELLEERNNEILR